MTRWVRPVLVIAAAIAFGLGAEHLGHGWEEPAWIPIFDLAIGWTMVGAGLVGSYLRPAQPAGRRLVAAGFLWFVGTARQPEYPQLGALAFAFSGYYDLVLVLIALSFPARWPSRRSERVALAAIAGLYVAQTGIRLLARAPQLVGAAPVFDEDVLPLVAWIDLARSLSMIAAGILIARRWVVATAPARRLLGPVVAAGAVTAIAATYGAVLPLTLLGIVPTPPDSVDVPLAWLFNLARLLVPIGMLVGILRERATRSAVATAIARVGPTPSGLALGDALRHALGDPSVEVLAWDATTGGYRNELGGPARLPGPDEPTTMTEIDGPSGRLAALVHDRALDEDPTLVAAGAAVVRLVAENERLGQEVARQLADVRASRSRIVEAGDAERRRIERDLHDGVQQRLVALALTLRRAGGRTPEDGAAVALSNGADEALAIVEDVRELARGIHPAILAEAGLPSALRALADRSPVPVVLGLDLDGRGSLTATSTGYYVASEALANVAKHASATTAWLRASDRAGALEIDVEDDGRGGADPAGDGLRGLGDRVSAVNGTFSVASRPAGGTIVSATIPFE